MAIICQVVCIRNEWRIAITLNYTNILQPVYFNVFFNGYLLQCIFSYPFNLRIRIIITYKIDKLFVKTSSFETNDKF